jgi:5'-phosphate synthase pdxT subunit
LPSVGVLALQGGVVLPGGESTTLIFLMNKWKLTRPLIKMGNSGFPIFGTCAGAILLSTEISEKEHIVKQESLQLADVKAVRNFFGRQTSSFVEFIDVTGLDEPFPGVFIRAPLLQPLSDKVDILSRVKDGPVLLRQENLWLSSFHPELTQDSRIHRLFLESNGILKGNI